VLLRGSRAYTATAAVSVVDLPSTQCVVLSDVSFIAVTGTDARRFLQGICTNDIGKLKPDAGDCIATSLLNNKGRILFNLLLYTLREKSVCSEQIWDNNLGVSDTGLLAELNTKNLEEFQRYLNLYKLRSKVDIRVVEADCLFVNRAFSPDQLAIINDSSSPDVLVASIDPRLEDFGTRVIINKHCTSLLAVIIYYTIATSLNTAISLSL